MNCKLMFVEGGKWLPLLLIMLVVMTSGIALAQTVYTADDVMRTLQVTAAKISPDGGHIAYTVRTPRKPSDEAGSAYVSLHVLDRQSGFSQPYLSGKVNVSGVAWKPDGKSITFLMTRGEKAKKQVWQIDLSGGEAYQLTKSPTSISSYQWHPDGKTLAYIAQEPPSAREKALKKKGYDFIFYEEEWKHRNLYHFDVAAKKTKKLTSDVTIWSFAFSPDGKKIAAGVSSRNLIDYQYAFQTIHLVDPASGELTELTANPRKLGNFAFSPDGKQLAFAAALEQKDHAVSQVFVIPVSGGTSKNLTEADFAGHVQWVAWKDNKTIYFRAGEGVYNTLSTVSSTGGKRKMILDGRKQEVSFNDPSMDKNHKYMAFVGQSPEIPGDVYVWKSGAKSMQRLTDLNPWLKDINLGKQVPYTYKARDGQAVEGLLIYPVGYKSGETYPLVMQIHGGPESHYTNRWITRYANPGQVLAGRGYLAFYPNYRASTGYGVKFGAYGYNDAAGVEFDDIADGIDALVNDGMADKDRVGLGGGSYGGFASAWFATYYTEKVRAVCMFVGISNLISKRGTTDIPYEELFVHSGKKLEEMWDQSLERSPIYYAHQSKTATLIYGGADDPRVHPAQGLELYRRMKMNDHPAVRLVYYPGEKHGNSKQPGQIDVVHRIMDWYDWYVKDAKPLDGPMPPLDISDRYGLDLPK